MLWAADPGSRDRVVRAPPDVSGGGGVVPNRIAPKAVQGGRQAGPEAASGASLGNLRNRYAGTASEQPGTTCKDKEKQASKVDAKTARRSERFELQRTAARLTPSLRVAGCLWAEVGSTVDLVRRAQDARFTGLQTCGSVWSCPCCSSRISEVRRGELRLLEEWAGSPLRGLRLVMMTLTARHRRRALSDMVDRMAKAKRRMQNRKAWQHLRESGMLFGTVSVREATHGEDHGWHPHYHVLCLVRAESDEEAAAMLEPMRRAWVDCLRKEGLTGTLKRAFHLQNGDAVSAYISKHGRDETDRKAATEAHAGWGIAEEMTLARTKRGKGQGSRSPWQILRDAAAGDEAAARLWQEYALVMHGRRQQVWSDGLKEAVGLVEVEDEEAAEGEEYTADEDEHLMSWERREWRRIRHLRAAILAAAEAGGAAAVRALLADPVDDDPVLIDTDDAPVTDAPLIMPDSVRDILSRSVLSPADLDLFIDYIDGPDVPVTSEMRAAAIASSKERQVKLKRNEKWI